MGRGKKRKGFNNNTSVSNRISEIVLLEQSFKLITLDKLETERVSKT